jgi:hypothetical protein
MSPPYGAPELSRSAVSCLDAGRGLDEPRVIDSVCEQLRSARAFSTSTYSTYPTYPRTRPSEGCGWTTSGGYCVNGKDAAND